MIYYLPDPSSVNYALNNNITVINAYENYNNFNNNNSNVVVGTVLLPPPDINMMYIYGDRRSSSMYFHYLKNNENVKSYIYTLIIAMINNKSFGIYFGDIHNDSTIKIINDFFNYLYKTFGIQLNNLSGNIRYGDFINENSYANTVTLMFVDNFINYKNFYNMMPKIGSDFNPNYMSPDVFNKYLHEYNKNENKNSQKIHKEPEPKRESEPEQESKKESKPKEVVVDKPKSSKPVQKVSSSKVNEKKKEVVKKTKKTSTKTTTKKSSSSKTKGTIKPLIIKEV